MDKLKLNEIMNCKCLQSIIEQDEKKHTMDEERFDTRTIQNPNGNGVIIFECFTSFRNKRINLKTQITEIDRNEKGFCGVPFLYCPICGSKTKHEIPTESFYAQFQSVGEK